MESKVASNKILINQESSTIKNMLTSLVLYEQRETTEIALEHGKLIEEPMVETNFQRLNDSCF